MAPITNLTRTLLLALLAVIFAVPGAAQQPAPPAKPNHAGHQLVFMTDFGVVDDSVAICKAVMLRIDPRLRIMDITHQVTPYSIVDGARFLSGTAPYYGPGTVFVVVIDPGVGSTRKAIVARSKRGQYFVLPDNGLLTMIEDRDGIAEVREITNRQWMIGSKLSSTFHGRDIFSPVGAHLARGDDFKQVGPVAGKLVRLDLTPARLEANGLSGGIIATDGPYGNLITNIEAEMFAKLGYRTGDSVQFTIAGKSYTMPFVRTFSDVPKDALLLYVDSRGFMAIAVNLGNAQTVLQITPPSPLAFQKKPGS
jgi:S-adenosylmethionine hydrolase